MEPVLTQPEQRLLINSQAAVVKYDCMRHVCVTLWADWQPK